MFCAPCLHEATPYLDPTVTVVSVYKWRFSTTIRLDARKDLSITKTVLSLMETQNIKSRWNCVVKSANILLTDKSKASLFLQRHTATVYIAVSINTSGRELFKLSAISIGSDCHTGTNNPRDKN